MKPYSFGNLNDEIIILLHSLGISQNTLLERQQQHLDLLTDADRLDAHAAFRLFSYQDRPELAERVLIEGVDAVRGPVRKAVATERNSMINKREEQRCRILIKDSRLLFGICDPVDVLKPGECFVRVTSDDNGLPRTLINTEVLVTRNPCLHPGDLQKFRVVDRPELAHLVDCIVFSTRGKRPAADLMSGGDLDGDKCNFVGSCTSIRLTQSKFSSAGIKNSSHRIYLKLPSILGRLNAKPLGLLHTKIGSSILRKQITQRSERSRSCTSSGRVSVGHTARNVNS